MRSFILAAGAMWLAAIGSASAQIPAWKLPKAGEAVRVHRYNGDTLVGALRRADPDSIRVVDRGGLTRTVALSSVRRVETYGIRWKTGAKRGAIVGGVLGLGLLGVAIYADTHIESDGHWPMATYLAAPVVLALPLAGTGIGLALSPTGWKTAASVTPVSFSQRGAGLALQIRF